MDEFDEVVTFNQMKIRALKNILEKIKKKWQVCFVGIEKSSTFASAFRKEQHLKKSSLKDLDMNKQVVQVLL